jgi:two-component system sensor histidine kinase AauS
MGRITASLRSFARRGDDQRPGLAGQAVEATLQVLGNRISLPSATAPPVRRPALADRPDRLEQILVNLIGNALDAMAGNRPRAVAGRRSADGKYRLLRDNGHGIDAEARKHLFEPFFTTKPGEHGLGLGLTLSASLAAATGAPAVEHPASGGTAFVLACPWRAPSEST